MIKLSQRDPRWVNIKLGTSNVTIGGFGCTITCLAMFIGTTPDVVNARLKAVNGFASGNLVIWSKVAEAFPGVSITKIGATYDNNDVKNNIPCLVEVDFDGTPRVDGRHWVLFVGNGKIYDPWTGTERPTSTYSPLFSFRLIKGTWEGVSGMANMYNGLDLANPESMKPCVDLYNKWRNGGLVEKSDYQKLETEVIELRKRPVSCPPVSDALVAAKLQKISELVKNDTSTKINEVLNG